LRFLTQRLSCLDCVFSSVDEDHALMTGLYEFGDL
jgi:hypothetical protein